MTERERERELIDYETDRLRIGENIDIKRRRRCFFVVIVVAFILCLTNPLFFVGQMNKIETQFKYILQDNK